MGVGGWGGTWGGGGAVKGSLHSNWQRGRGRWAFKATALRAYTSGTGSSEAPRQRLPEYPNNGAKQSSVER